MALCPLYGPLHRYSPLHFYGPLQPSVPSMALCPLRPSAPSTKNVFFLTLSWNNDVCFANYVSPLRPSCKTAKQAKWSLLFRKIITRVFRKCFAKHFAKRFVKNLTTVYLDLILESMVQQHWVFSIIEQNSAAPQILFQGSGDNYPCPTSKWIGKWEAHFTDGATNFLSAPLALPETVQSWTSPAWDSAQCHAPCLDCVSILFWDCATSLDK